MKDIKTILTNIGVTIPEDKTNDFDKAFAENYKTIAECNKLTAARDNYKTQLETAQETLKGFEGVDVDELKNKIEALQNDLKTKDTEYQNKIADMEFGAVLDSALGASKARNSKAVKALLDVDTLKQSKNQQRTSRKRWKPSRTKTATCLSRTSRSRTQSAAQYRRQCRNSDPMAAFRAAMGLPNEK